MFLLTLSVRVKHIWWSVRDLDHASMVHHLLGSHDLTKLKIKSKQQESMVCKDIVYGSGRTIIP